MDIYVFSILHDQKSTEPFFYVSPWVHIVSTFTLEGDMVASKAFVEYTTVLDPENTPHSDSAAVGMRISLHLCQHLLLSDFLAHVNWGIWNDL